MNDKRRKGTRAKRQRQTQADASGGKSVSEKSESTGKYVSEKSKPTGGKVSEKFQATCTSKNPCILIC
jgi:hypothetical protein